MKNERCVLRINVPIVLLLAVLFVFFVCRYKVLAGTSIILFLSEITVILIMCIIRRSNDVKYDMRIIYFHLSFMIYRIIISALVSGGFNEGTRRVLLYEICPLLIMSLFVQILSTQKIVNVLKTIGIMNICFGLYEYAFKTNILAGFIDNPARLSSFTFGTGAYRLRTVFMHPIICAVFLTFIWFVLLFFPIKNRIYDLIIKICLIICLLGTQARSSWISFAVVNVMLLIITMVHDTKEATLNNVLFVVGGGILILILLLLFSSKSSEVLNMVLVRWADGMDKHSDAHYNRIHMIKLGIDAFKKSTLFNMFFGSGSGYALSFLKSHAIRGWKAAVDNTFITVLLDYGGIGVLLLINYFNIAFKNIKESNPICRMSGAGLLAILVSGMFYDLFNWFTTDMIINILICLIVYKQNDNDGAVGVNVSKTASFD